MTYLQKAWALGLLSFVLNAVLPYAIYKFTPGWDRPLRFALMGTLAMAAAYLTMWLFRRLQSSQRRKYQALRGSLANRPASLQEPRPAWHLLHGWHFLLVPGVVGVAYGAYLGSYLLMGAGGVALWFAVDLAEKAFERMDNFKG